VHAQATKDTSLHALHEFSPNDISGFTSLSGDNAIAGVTLPFSVVIDGVSYGTATIGTNGLVQFGTTTGANPTTNGALPSASFPGPTLFWYWDDLQPFSSNIQYGSVGTSPNRTFIIDFQENRVGDTGNVVNGQVQIHEGSNQMNVRYPEHHERRGERAERDHRLPGRRRRIGEGLPAHVQREDPGRQPSRCRLVGEPAALLRRRHPAVRLAVQRAV
jgi:hypothetical protein